MGVLLSLCVRRSLPCENNLDSSSFVFFIGYAPYNNYAYHVNYLTLSLLIKVRVINLSIQIKRHFQPQKKHLEN